MDNIEFGILISYLSVQDNRGGYNVDAIETIAKLVSDCQQDPNRVSQVDVNELLKQMALNDKIPAIKAYRSLTGASLLDAKNAVEKYLVSKPTPMDRFS